jgi:hypothetical protein
VIFSSTIDLKIENHSISRVKIKSSNSKPSYMSYWYDYIATVGRSTHRYSIIRVRARFSFVIVLKHYTHVKRNLFPVRVEPSTYSSMRSRGKKNYGKYIYVYAVNMHAWRWKEQENRVNVNVIYGSIYCNALIRRRSCTGGGQIDRRIHARPCQWRGWWSAVRIRIYSRSGGGGGWRIAPGYPLMDGKLQPAIRLQPTGKSLWGVSDMAPCRAYQSAGIYKLLH